MSIEIGELTTFYIKIGWMGSPRTSSAKMEGLHPQHNKEGEQEEDEGESQEGELSWAASSNNVSLLFAGTSASGLLGNSEAGESK
ncbi:hypothetical protein H8959_001062 [Pygathrix nigripes]